MADHQLAHQRPAVSTALAYYLPAALVILLALAASFSPWAVPALALFLVLPLIIKRPLVLVAVLALVLPINRWSFDVGFYLRPYHILVLLALPLYLWYWAAGKLPAIRFNLVDLALVAFLACCLLSFAVSSELSWSLRKLMSLVWVALLYLTIRLLVQTKAALRVMITVAGISMGLFAAGGLLVMALFVQRGLFSDLVPIPEGITPRLAYLHTDANFYGMYIAIYLIFAIVLLLRYPRVHPWLKALLVVLLGSNLVLAFSRGAFLAFVLILPAILFVFRRHISRRGFLVVLLLLAAGALIVAVLLPQSVWFSQWQRLAGTLEQIGVGRESRLAIFTYTLGNIVRHPFLGLGLGTSRAWHTSIMYAHNLFLEVLQDAGLVGMAGYLFLISSVALMGLRAYRRSSDDYLKAVLAAALFALGFFHLQALTLNAVQDVMLWALIGLIVAVVVIADRQSRDSHHACRPV